MKEKKYKLTLLKDLPNHKAGTVVLNISQKELRGIKNYKYRGYIAEKNFSDIYDLRNNAEWVKVEEDNRCDCLTKDCIEILCECIGYGRRLDVGLSFTKRQITTYYDYAYESGEYRNLPIKYCPLCGRELTKE